MSGKIQKILVSVIVFMVLAVAVPAIAAAEETNNLTLDQRSAGLYLQSIQPLLDQDNETMWATVYEDPFGGFDKAQIGKAKSTHRAFLMSLLVPGSGQIYTKSSFIKPLLFLGIEAATIAGYMNFHGKGEDQRDIYQAYADENWSYDGYVQSLEHFYTSAEWRYGDTAKWYESGQGEWINTFSEHLGGSIDPDSDSLRPERDYAYYENVGKYPQFQYGWTDIDFIDIDADSLFQLQTSAEKNTYLRMRKDANEEFSKATNMLFVMMANHLVSAFDAALSARRHNRKQEALAEVSFQMRYVMHYGKPMPKFTMSVLY